METFIVFSTFLGLVFATYQAAELAALLMKPRSR